MMTLLDLVERRFLPDGVVRYGIRRRLAAKLAEERAKAPDPGAALDRFAEELAARPVAEAMDAANRQHYEVPAAFFREVLGARLKYSGGYWDGVASTLDRSEERMLDLYVERGRLADGQRILDLGCGWGSLSLYLAERFPRARVLGVSNSTGQREFVLAEARRRGLANLDVRTLDVNDLAVDGTFDRVVSIEMFEHMKNYRRLLTRIAALLEPDGCLFIHIFTHRRYAYHFEGAAEKDWMARHFFTGGTMPAHALLQRFSDDLVIAEDWSVDGTHYARTSEAWLANLDARRDRVLPILASTYGEKNAARWMMRWRLFFMACAELFGYGGGGEWQVSQYRFVKAGRTRA